MQLASILFINYALSSQISNVFMPPKFKVIDSIIKNMMLESIL
jgi:hypothetical protein